LENSFLHLTFFFRYFVPEEAQLDNAEIKTIQLRVINTVKMWMTTRMQDFDSVLLHHVREFAKIVTEEGCAHLAKQITNTIERKVRTFSN